MLPPMRARLGLAGLGGEIISPPRASRNCLMNNGHGIEAYVPGSCMFAPDVGMAARCFRTESQPFLR